MHARINSQIRRVKSQGIKDLSWGNSDEVFVTFWMRSRSNRMAKVNFHEFRVALNSYMHFVQQRRLPGMTGCVPGHTG
jgi:hypothetical protein